ncbi:acyl-homoserine-lactone synthase [Bradyrhizobium erythrophlei]|uniref:acyl-homoserine-lactone synthase n=1 Tax=Bradyrhizobium erythrophlei TaxID=1437360 RepID=UPI0035E95580
MALEQSDVVGCVRLLPTTGRNMLADTFPVLLDGQRGTEGCQDLGELALLR